MGTTECESTRAQATRSFPNPASSSACPCHESLKISSMLSPYFPSMRAHALAASLIVNDDPGCVMERTYRPAHAASSRLKCPSVPAQTIEISLERAAALSIADTAE